MDLFPASTMERESIEIHFPEGVFGNHQVGKVVLLGILVVVIPLPEQDENYTDTNLYWQKAES